MVLPWSLFCPGESALFRLGLLVVLLPILTFHASFLVSLAEGSLRPCNPYWADCHSVSAGGRHGTAYFLFKGGMLPACLGLWLFWLGCGRWLSLMREPLPGLPALAALSSLALLAYSLTLGHKGEGLWFDPALVRRIGIGAFLFLTYLLQLRIAAAMARLPSLAGAGTIGLGACCVFLAVCLISLVWQWGWPLHYDTWENGIEWGLISLLNLMMLPILWGWRRTGFQLEARVGP